MGVVSRAITGTSEGGRHVTTRRLVSPTAPVTRCRAAARPVRAGVTPQRGRRPASGPPRPGGAVSSIAGATQAPGRGDAPARAAGCGARPQDGGARSAAKEGGRICAARGVAHAAAPVPTGTQVALRGAGGGIATAAARGSRRRRVVSRRATPLGLGAYPVGQGIAAGAPRSKGARLCGLRASVSVIVAGARVSSGRLGPGLRGRGGPTTRGRGGGPATLGGSLRVATPKEGVASGCGAGSDVPST